MKTPWIHYERMQQIHSKQMNVFQSSRVQKKPIYPGFPCINKERTKKENNGCESNTAPSRADTVETVNLHENYDIKKMPKLHKKIMYPNVEMYTKRVIWRKETKQAAPLFLHHHLTGTILNKFSQRTAMF